MNVDGDRDGMEMGTGPRDLAAPAPPQSQRDATPRVKGACPAASLGGRGH